MTELVIRNDLAQIATVAEAMERVGVEHDLAPRSLIGFQVALDEILSNIIRDAWPDGGSHQIRVSITVTSEQVEVEVVDDGIAFDPLAAPEPRAIQPGQRPRPGGLGIHLVRRLMDRVEYARVGGCNRLTIIKHRAEGATDGHQGDATT